MLFPTSDEPQEQANEVTRESRAVARPLVPVTLALMAGIAAPAWGLRLPGIVLAAGLILLWVGLALLWWRRRPVRLLPLLFFGLLGAASYQQASQPWFPPGHVAHLPENRNLTLWGHLSRPGRLGEGRVQLFMEAEAWRSPWGWRPVTGQVLVLAPALEVPPVGTGLVISGRLRPPGKLNNPGTFDRPRYLAADGIFREVRLSDPSHLIFLTATDAYPWGERLRGGIRQQLRGLDPTCRAIYLAMLLGDQGEVTREMRQNFARTGTSHLLVINGLHLGMVAAVTFFLSFWLLRRFPWLLLRLNAYKIATLLSVFPVVAYAWVAGGSPSTQRAEVMVLAYLLLVFLGRPGEVWSALALAALVILSLTPLRLFAISFQLSFVAVAALIYLVPRLVKVVPEIGWGGNRSMALGDFLAKGLVALTLSLMAILATAPLVPAYFQNLWVNLAYWAKRLALPAKEWLAVSLVATLATAPLVAAYFQIVSLLGFLINYAAIPLFLLLALPLGEAAVFAQALSLPAVAQALLALGKVPLWLGYQTVVWGAQVPGSAIIMPTPTWLEIGLYYLILFLIFAPRRTYLTWAGAGLASVVLITAAALPLATVSRTLEVTCLDAYGGLRVLAVSPENRRLAVSAAAPVWPGHPSPEWGPLPAYCHWRQFRRLDLVLALNLNEDNAGELRQLAEQFQVGSYWSGRRGREGPQFWDLRNYLGERGAVPRSLEWDQAPANLGGAAIKYVSLGRDAGLALELAYQGRRVLLIPPGRDLAGYDLPKAAGPLEALVLPAELANPRGRNLLMASFKPRQVVIYGDSRPFGGTRTTWPVPCQYTREGAVSLYLADSGVTVRQWRP
ncbi:MAG: ComEC family competence protein [Syntrophobacterales bacterium]|jgi:competence protein ComEC|nr:ComEC family competence protein [Syntrophobacterales bacterium]